MCVIFICETHVPTAEMITKAWNTNPDGAGIAHREGKGEKAVVRWRKGLTLEQIREEIEALKHKLPIIVHFRKQSVGGVRTDLCHPFTADAAADNALEGKTKSAVFFHNGTWKVWQDVLLQTCVNHGLVIPDGEWSDTRALALLTTVYGPNFPRIIEGQKGVLFGPGPDDINVFYGSNWYRENNVLCSNLIWKNETRNYMGFGQGQSEYDYRPACRERGCWEKDNLDKDQRCPKHPLARGKASSGGNNSSTDAATDKKKTPELGGAQVFATPFALFAEAKLQMEAGQIGKKPYNKAMRLFDSVIKNHLKAQQGGPLH